MAYTAEHSAQIHEHWASIDKYGRPEPVNIFYLDHDPALAAQAHCDTHVVKMILETGQLLSTAWHVASAEAVASDWYPPTSDIVVPEGEVPWLHYQLAGQRIYRKTHEHHPCAVWVRKSAANYQWLHRLGMELLAEYTFRYGRQHFSAPVMWTLELVPPTLSTNSPLSEPPCAMPDEFIVTDDEGYVDAVASYRAYYVGAKQALLKWRHRGPPHWIKTEGAKFALT